MQRTCAWGSWMRPNAHALVHHVHRAHRASSALYALGDEKCCMQLTVHAQPTFPLSCTSNPTSPLRPGQLSASPVRGPSGIEEGDVVE